MKKYIITIGLLIYSLAFYAQKQTYEFVIYTPPAGWKKEVKQNTYTSYTTTNSQKNSYCQILIMLSTNSKGGIDEDFESEWQGLIVKSYGVTESPDITEPTTENGWTTKGGVAGFTYDKAQSIAMLTTMSGYSKAVSIIAITNSKDYMPVIESFLGSVIMGKPQNNTNVVSDNNTGNSSIIGTWSITASDQSSWRVNNGVMSHITRQYTFNANGSYSFFSKTFDPLLNDMLLGRESGTYQISGNSITVSPQKSLLEKWSKKDGRNEWGNLLNSQNLTLEKTTYQYTKHYFSGIQEWNLVLQSDKPAFRDGPYSSNNTFINAWYYRTISSNNPLIELP